jgi:hypothetical protein
VTLDRVPTHEYILSIGVHGMSDHDTRRQPPEPEPAQPGHMPTLSLSDDAVASLASTAVKLARFAPEVSDPDALAILVDAVTESAQANESISQLKERLMRLGDRVVAVAREVARLL